MQCTINDKSYIVLREEISEDGVKFSTPMENVTGLDKFDQTNSEIKQAKNRVDSYKDYIKEFVIAEKRTGKILEELDSNQLSDIKDLYENIKNITDDKVVLSKAEAINLSALITQKSSVEAQRTANSTSLAHYDKQTSDYTIQIDNIQRQISVMKENNNLNKESMWHLYHNPSSNTTLSQEQIANYVAINEAGTIDTEITIVASRVYEENYLNDIMASVASKNLYLMTKMDAVQYLSLKKQLVALQNSKNMVIFQRATASSQVNQATNQLTLIEEQIVALIDKSVEYQNKLCEVFQKYLEEYNNIEYLKRITPVSFGFGNSVIKGFNENGKLVTLQNMIGTQLVIEYDNIDANENLKISRIYDKNQKEISLHYSSNGLLKEIINSVGEIVTYEYDGFENLIKVNYSDNQHLSLGKGMNYLKASNDYKYTKITYSDNKVTSVEYFTTISEVNYSGTTYFDEPYSLEKLDFVCGLNATVTNTAKKLVERYKFNSKGYIEERYVTRDGKYIEAKLYRHLKYGYYTIFTANEEALYNENVNVDGNAYVETKSFDSFNRIKTESVGNKTIHISNGEAVRADVTTGYTYNDKGQIIKTVTEEYFHTDELMIKEFVHVALFEYNDKGQLLKKQSYTEGEEKINGINIEEHVYDKNGYEIKKITYNSLDPSSKYYEEIEVNEKGQAVTKYDSTGRYKTKYQYADNANSVSSEILPNGNKLSYGSSLIDQTSSVTMSTDEGEENKIVVHRNHGYVVRVEDDSVLEYPNYTFSYDYKGRRLVSSNYFNSLETNEYQDTENGVTIGEQTKKKVITRDIYGNILSIAETDGTARNIVFEYDKRFNVVKSVETDTKEITTTFTYDSLGKLIKAVKIFRTLDGSSIIDAQSEEYTYNNFGDVVKRTLVFVSGETITYSYNYSDDSLRKLIGEIQQQNSISTNYKTDGFGRMVYNGDEQMRYLSYGDHTTSLPCGIVYIGNGSGSTRGEIKNVSYKYDSMGNITKVYENGLFSIEYRYDALGRLVRENNKPLNKTVVFNYDRTGNILSKVIYPFTLKPNEYLYELDGETETYMYFKGLLVEYNGNAISYKNFKYPLIYKNNTLSWRYNKLASYGETTFTYDMSGKRLTKNNISYNYDLNGNLAFQSNGIKFFYANNSIKCFSYAGNVYTFRKDIFGNVVEILDSLGNTVVKYVYDAWGNHKVLNPDGTENTAEDFIGNINPIRYRSYYYDTETKLYYLNARYYDPEVCRFISPDDISYLDPETIGGTNLYSYCNNNPVMYVDPTGKFPILALVLGITALVGLGLTIGGVALDNNTLTAIGLTMVAIPALISGVGAIAAGVGGATLTGIVGGVTTLAGVGTGLFASAEYQEAFTGSNWMLDAGMSESWYNGLMLTVATIATAGTFASGILSSSSKIGNTIIGEQFNPKGTAQIGVDPNSLTINRTLNPNKIKIVKKILKKDGMYGVIEVNKSGLIIDGNHRVFVARMLKMAVDVIIL